MTPITSSTIEGGNRYSFPIIGSITERLTERLDVSELYDTGLVDSDGYLVPGSVLRISNMLLLPITAGGQVARGIVLETTKVAESNSETHLDAADNIDIVIVVGCTLDRANAEFNMDRAFSANELEAINANDRITLTDPES